MAKANGYIGEVLPSMPPRPVIVANLENLSDPDLHHELKIVQKVLMNPKAIATLGDEGAKLRKHVSDLEAEVKRRSAQATTSKSTSPTTTESNTVDDKIDAMIKRSHDLGREKFVPARAGPHKFSITNSKVQDDNPILPGDKSLELREHLTSKAKFKYDEALVGPKPRSSPIKPMSLTESMAQCKIEGSREVARQKKLEESQEKKTVGERSGHEKVNSVPFYSRYAVLPKKDVEEDLDSDDSVDIDDSLSEEDEEDDDKEAENDTKERR